LTLNLPAFLASVIAISLSGVMAPGPVLAVTISKGRMNGNAGGLHSRGDTGVIEIPLMTGIYLGFAQLLVLDAVKSHRRLSRRPNAALHGVHEYGKAPRGRGGKTLIQQAAPS
jgi:hypothetical protein